MMQSLARFSIAVAIAAMSASVLCEPIGEAEDALRKRDVATAIRVLETAAGAGNLVAKGRLASYLRTLPPPYRDVERACILAREASADGDAMGSITRAECLITGTEKAERPFTLARDLARKALKSGFPTAGFTIYQVFITDPQYSYPSEDAVGGAKYNALAAMPISARADQIEAFEGLADAIRSGHINAMFTALAYFIDSSAPGNIDRLLVGAGLLQKSGEEIPQRLIPFVRFAQEIKRLGTTHASVTAFNNAYKLALLAAFHQIRGPGESSGCDIKEIKLVQVSAGPVNNPEYLPISKDPFVNTYLVRGNWSETWTFTGCQKSLPLQMTFTADGWSGAKFQTSYSSGNPTESR